MRSLYRKLMELLTARQKKVVFVVLAVMILAAFAEILGLSVFMALLGVLSDPERINENEWLSAAYNWFGSESVFSFQLTLSLIVAAVIILSIVVKASAFFLLTLFGVLTGQSLSARMLRAYLRQPYSWYLDRNSADLGRKILMECEQLVQKAIRPSLEILASFLQALSIIAFLVVVDPAIALLAFGILGGGYSGIYVFARKRLHRLGVDVVEANKERFRITQEATAGLKEVKLAGLEDVYANEFYAPSRRRAMLTFQIQMFNDIPRFVLEALTFIVLLSMVLVLLIRNDGNLLGAIPVLGVFAFSVMRVLPALQKIYYGFASLRSGQAIVDQVYSEYVEIGAGNLTYGGISRVDRHGLQDALVFKDVSYTYPSAQKVALSNLNIHIPAGNTVGIVGGTGAGKTTFVDLLLGLLAPDSGHIIVDGTEITSANLRAWQNTVGYVPQQIFLTDDTISANIAFGIPADEVDHAAVEAAARAAALHDFIIEELPQGYETRVGERGVRLSGGQRQRIGIARALYHDPSLLILDEATSALDNITERAVMEAVQQLHGQKTIIMIAHRLTTVENCDNIILMERGKISAVGTYAELERENATFQNMLGKTA